MALCAPRALLRFTALRLAVPFAFRVAAASTAAALPPLELIGAAALGAAALDSAISAAEERVGGIQRVVEARQKELEAAEAALEPLVKRRATLRAEAALPAWLDRTLGKLKAAPGELAALRERLEAGLSAPPLAVCTYEDEVRESSYEGGDAGWHEMTLTRRRYSFTLSYVFHGKEVEVVRRQGFYEENPEPEAEPSDYEMDDQLVSNIVDLLEKREDGAQEDGKWLFTAVTSKFFPGHYGKEEEEARAPARVNDNVEEPQASAPGKGGSGGEGQDAFVMPLDAEGRPDFGPHILGSLAAWRAAHPTALVATLTWRNQSSLCDADLAALRDIRALKLLYCSGITDAGLAHLRSIHTLYLSNCCADVTDAGLAHMRGMHTLKVDASRGIKGAGLVRLRGLHTLEMERCGGITGACLVHLRGLHRLSIQDCGGVTYAAIQAAKRALGATEVRYQSVGVEDGDNDKRPDALLPLNLALLADEEVQEVWEDFVSSSM